MMTGKKIVAALLLICCFQVGCGSGDGALKKAAKEKVQELCKATVDGDFKKVGQMMHPKPIAQAGGLEKFIETMQATTDSMTEQGFKVEAIEVSDASEIGRKENDIYVVVPTKTIVKTPDGKMSVKSYQVGQTTIGGQNWSFVSGDMGPKMLRDTFATFPENMKLPEKEAPVTHSQ